MGVSFDDKTKSRFFLLALQLKYIEVNRFVDILDNVPDDDPMHKEFTIGELVLLIKDIHFLQNSPATFTNRFVCPPNDRDSSNPRHNRQSSSSYSRPPRPSSSDARPVRDVHTCSYNQSMC
jgi:hypothetical protein